MRNHEIGDMMGFGRALTAHLAMCVASLVLLSACVPPHEVVLSTPTSATELISNIEASIQNDLILTPNFYRRENLLKVFGGADLTTSIYSKGKDISVTGFPPSFGITGLPMSVGNPDMILSVYESGSSITHVKIQIYFGASTQAPTFEALATGLGPGWERNIDKENEQFAAAMGEPLNRNVKLQHPLILSYRMVRSGRSIDLSFSQNHRLWSLFY